MNSYSAHADISLESNMFSSIVGAQEGESSFVVRKTTERRGPLERIRYEITNIAVSPLAVTPVSILVGTQMEGEQDPEAGFGASFYAYLTPYVAGALTGEVYTLDSESRDDFSGLQRKDWFGWNSRYHFEAIRILSGAGTLRLKYPDNEADELKPSNLILEWAADARLLQPGDVLELEFEYLVAVKSRQLLQDSNLNMEGLLLKNLWGWVRGVCFLIWDLLDYLFALCGNWGLSIVLLALVIRVLTIPITKISLNYQKRSIVQQNKIAPRIRDIKQQYSGIEQSEKIIELYTEENYDHLAPFKGMLGLFVQLPIFVGLFNVIGETTSLSGQAFLWIDDLARSDRLLDFGFAIPYFGSYFNLLPVVMAVVTILSTWLAGRNSGNENQPTLSLFGMGGAFFILFYSFPAGLVLYWLCSNFFQLIQQTVENSMQARI